MSQTVKNLPAMRETWVWSLGWGHSLEEGMATHSSILQQDYWSGSPFSSSGDLPNPGIGPRSPALQADSLLSEPPGKPSFYIYWPPNKTYNKHIDTYNQLCLEALTSFFPECSGCDGHGGYSSVIFLNSCSRTSLAVLWLRFRASNAGGTSSNSDWGTKIKIPHAVNHNQKEKHSLKKKNSGLYLI